MAALLLRVVPLGFDSVKNQVQYFEESEIIFNFAANIDNDSAAKDKNQYEYCNINQSS
jgi:hypothetical protein